ncbi:acyltransferase [Stenotrophomonas sp. Iso1]|uniref:acyltransferase family protein n=1 Tax=Stenotrophomonas sp. Iso1 TaxID=2977283 RepID=UPI0022B7BE5C|nr:acyltransferase [Stenotrophomonas sp. Iso1]
MTSRPFHSVQALRAIAALLVVLFHLEIVEQKYSAASPVIPALLRFADSGVDLFFVLSGFVMTTIAAGRYGSPRNAAQFLVRRGWRVLPLYWFYTSIVVLLMLVAPGMANSSYQDQNIVASYLLWPQPQLPLLTVGWTLIHEMFFYLVMAALIAFARQSQLPWLLLGWAVITLAAHHLLGPTAAPWQRIASSPLTLEFIAGALVGLYWNRLPARLALPTAGIGAAGFVGVMLALAHVDAQATSASLRMLGFGLPAALITLGLVRWERATEPSLPRPLLLIGDSSYSLYLSHVFVISAMGRLWQKSGLNTAVWHSWLFVLLAVLACVAAGLISWRMLERPLQQLRFLRRGKRPEPRPMPG